MLFVAAISCPLASLGADPKPTSAKPPDTTSSDARPLYTPRQFERLGERDQLVEQKEQFKCDGKFAEAIAASEKIIAIDREVLGTDHYDTFRALLGLAGTEVINGDQAALKNCFASWPICRRKATGPAPGGPSMCDYRTTS